LDTLSADSVEDRLRKAIARLLEEDRFLLVNNVNERSISHKLAEHLQVQFSEWHVDCEYNRNHESIKTLKREMPNMSADDTEAQTVYPDIIVHHRDTDQNLLVIEIKKSSNPDNRNRDLKKLRSFISQLRYTYAAFIEFATGTENVIAKLEFGDTEKEFLR
jgi:hypothetical protein